MNRQVVESDLLQEKGSVVLFLICPEGGVNFGFQLGNVLGAVIPMMPKYINMLPSLHKNDHDDGQLPFIVYLLRFQHYSKYFMC